MWLITGPFDSETGDVTTTKTKLLKTGQKVILGRKDKPLSVNSKKVSHKHCEFSVGPCTEDDVADPAFVPTIEIHNPREKPVTIDREGQPLVVNPVSSYELKSGDKVHIVGGVSVVVQWRRIACFLPPARGLPSISTGECATLGIHLISSPSSLATHHLTAKYELSVSLATSLLSATQLVKAEWLQELIRLGAPDENNPFKQSPLERTFIPPAESKYRPSFSASLPASLKSFKFWEPNEERLRLLKGYRFVLVSETEARVDGDARELVTRGDAEYECFPLTNGEAKWRQLLGKAKRRVDENGLKVAIVARQLAVETAVGVDRWQEMVAEVESLSLPFINVDTLINAVVHTDTSLLHQGSLTKDPLRASGSPLPDFVPNTHPDEPSPTPPIAQKALPAPRVPSEPNVTPVAKATLVPKTSSVATVRKSPSPSPPAMLLGLSIPPPPSKILLRRAKPSSRSEEPVASGSNEDALAGGVGYSLPAVPVMARSSRLRRRTPGPPPSVPKPVAEDVSSEEPPLKKFKELFDATDPDKMNLDTQGVQQAYDMATGPAGSSQGGGSLTQSDSRLPSQTVAPPRTLDTVAEEEGESCQTQDPTLAPARPRTHLETQKSQAKASHGAETSSKPPSKQARSKKPTPDHQMDTDPVFLTALASKKGKKGAEDDFDREFNKLRISRPEIRREEDQPWEILGDFDIEARNIRGNFMVVIDLEVYRQGPQHRNNGLTRSHDGRKNFKKFKKSPTSFSRAPIELVAKGENDYGVGSGYWKDRVILNGKESQTPTQTTGTQKRRAATVLESDDAGDGAPPAKRTKGEARKPAQPKASKAVEKLFLNSDEDTVPVANPEGFVNQSQTMKTTAPVVAVKGTKRRHIIVDDDSDDGVAFKGFSKKRRVQ